MDTQFRLDAAKNSTMSLDALDTALRDVRANSFNYLNAIQKEIGLFKKFDFRMADVKLITGPFEKIKKYALYVPEDFISPRKRLEYKRSTFFNREINLAAIVNNSALFTMAYMVFIDGKFYDTVSLICREGVSQFIFDVQSATNPTGLPQSHIDQLIASNAKITVIFIPNCEYGLYNTNINVLTKYKDDLSLSRFGLKNNISTETKYLTFVNNNNLLFAGVVTDTTNSAGLLKFTNNAINDFEHKLVHINIFGFRNVLDEISLTGTTKYFQLPVHDMPIPAENFIVFRKVGDVRYYAHDIKIKLYYPNYYEVLNNTANEDLLIYPFYFDDTLATDNKYTNDLDLYYQKMGVGFNEFVAGTLPSYVANYQPGIYDYDFKDFGVDPVYDDNFKYKVNTFKEWIASNPEVLRTYFNNQIQKNDGFYIDCSQVDLSSKIRTNNYAEVEYESQKKTFSEQRYLFILKSVYADYVEGFRFFIDGLLYVPDIVYKNGIYEYYYLPKSMITSTTIIEIERIDSFHFQKDIKATNTTDWIAVTDSNSTNQIDANDVFIIDKTTKKFLADSDFTVGVDEDGIRVPLPDVSFKRISNTFYVRINNAAYVNKDLTLFVKQYMYFAERKITDSFDKALVFIYPAGANRDGRYIRLFKNGRLLHDSLKYSEFSDYLNGENFSNPTLRSEVGDSIVLDATPYCYKVVYEQKNVLSNGFINLQGIISRPFDFKWYDVYLNGRKLNFYNVDIISPSLIFIKNVKSLKNFVIIEKNRETEYFSIGNAKSPVDTMWATIPEFKNKLLTRPAIIDTEQDIVTEILDTMTLRMMYFFTSLIFNYGYFNPDWNQITDEIRTKYAAVMPDAPAFIFNPDINPEADILFGVFPKKI